MNLFREGQEQEPEKRNSFFFQCFFFQTGADPPYIPGFGNAIVDFKGFRRKFCSDIIKIIFNEISDFFCYFCKSDLFAGSS